MDWRCELIERETPAANAWRYARNIWTMKRVGDRLYLGSGNSSNRGPAINAGSQYGGVPVVYYDLRYDVFRTEAILEDEQIDRYVMLNQKLCIPAHDPTEDWSFGNYYCRQWDGRWQKIRNIPDGIHVYDLVFHNMYKHAAIARRYCPETDTRGEVLFFDENQNICVTAGFMAPSFAGMQCPP